MPLPFLAKSVCTKPSIIAPVMHSFLRWGISFLLLWVVSATPEPTQTISEFHFLIDELYPTNLRLSQELEIHVASCLLLPFQNRTTSLLSYSQSNSIGWGSRVESTLYAFKILPMWNFSPSSNYVRFSFLSCFKALFNLGFMIENDYPLDGIKFDNPSTEKRGNLTLAKIFYERLASFTCSLNRSCTTFFKMTSCRWPICVFFAKTLSEQTLLSATGTM